MSEEKKFEFGIEEIKKRIPHRYPFLLIDRVLEIRESEITTLKNVTISEEFFQGHFPSRPIMPGVLIVEAMGQSAAVLVNKDSGFEGKLVYFTTIEKTHFRKPVLPGDSLILKVSVEKSRDTFWKFGGKAFVADEKVADCTFSAVVVDNNMEE